MYRNCLYKERIKELQLELIQMEAADPGPQAFDMTVADAIEEIELYEQIKSQYNLSNHGIYNG